MVGKLGPYKSASKIPTFFPYLNIENARFTATVDFPTPPLQLLTAMIFCTFCSPFLIMLEAFYVVC